MVSKFRLLIIFFFFVFSAFHAYSQDTIIRRNKEIIECTIIGSDKQSIAYIKPQQPSKIVDTLKNSEVLEVTKKNNTYLIVLQNKKTIETDSIEYLDKFLIAHTHLKTEPESYYLSFSEIDSVNSSKNNPNSIKAIEKFTAFRKRVLEDSLAKLREETLEQKDTTRLLNLDKQICKHFAFPTWAAFCTKNYPDVLAFAAGDALSLLAIGLIGGSGEMHIPFPGYLSLMLMWRIVTVPIAITQTLMYNYRIRCEKENKEPDLHLGYGTELNAANNDFLYPVPRDVLFFYAGYKRFYFGFSYSFNGRITNYITENKRQQAFSTEKYFSQVFFYKTKLHHIIYSSYGFKLKQCTAERDKSYFDNANYVYIEDKETFGVFSAGVFLQPSILLFKKYEIAPYIEYDFHITNRIKELMKKHNIPYYPLEIGVRAMYWW